MFTLIAALALAAPPAKKTEADFERVPIAATAAEIAAVRKGLDDKLADADSAKLKDFLVIHSPSGIADACGMVNAKNRFGAYVGYQKIEMIVIPTKDGGIMASPISLDDQIASQACRSKGM